MPQFLAAVAVVAIRAAIIGAKLMSESATANGGGVAADGVVAFLKSVGAAGAAALPVVAKAAIGVASIGLTLLV